MTSFVRVNGAAGLDHIGDDCDAFRVVLVALADDHDRLPLARLSELGAAIDAVVFEVGGVHMAAAIGAIDKEWEDKVKRLLKAELARKGLTYADLVGKLADIGVMDSEPNVRNKISRGKFAGLFLL